MNLKMKTLAAAVIATAAMSTANANSLLFPYYNFSASGDMSFMSIQASSTMNIVPIVPPGGQIAGTVLGMPVHWVYFGSEPKAADKLNSNTYCKHLQDGYGYLTPNDMVNMQVNADVASPSNNYSGNRFGDQSATFSVTLPAAAGFAVVSTVTGQFGGNPAADDITGEMIVVNANPNIVFGYAALTNNTTAEMDFSNITAQNYDLSWFPEDAMISQWYALPVGTQTQNINGDWTARAKDTIDQVFNRDELPLSQSEKPKLSCGTTLTIGKPVDATGAQLVANANLIATQNGGLLHSSWTPQVEDKDGKYVNVGDPTAVDQTANASTGVVMFKIEQPKFVANANGYFTMLRNTGATGRLGF